MSMYYGPQGDRCVHLIPEVTKKLALLIERNRGPAVKKKNPNSNIQRCIAVVRQFGTETVPLTCMEIAQELSLDINIVQSRLATSIRKERHLHRKTIRLTTVSRKSFVYWWNERKLNPDFGLLVLEKTRGGLPVDRFTNTIVPPAPFVAPRQVAGPGSALRKLVEEVRPDPKPAPIGVGASTTLTFKAGVIVVTPVELRTLYAQLKELFE